MDQNEDRRLRKRLRHVTDVFVTSGPMFEPAKSGDISPGGMFVETQLTYERGGEVELRFELDGRRFQVDGMVSHVKRNVGVGVRFLNISAEERIHLVQFIHRARAESEAENMLCDLLTAE